MRDPPFLKDSNDLLASSEPSLNIIYLPFIFSIVKSSFSSVPRVFAYNYAPNLKVLPYEDPRLDGVIASFPLVIIVP